MIAPVDPYVAHVLASIEAAEKAAGLVPVTDGRTWYMVIGRDRHYDHYLLGLTDKRPRT